MVAQLQGPRTVSRIAIHADTQNRVHPIFCYTTVRFQPIIALEIC